MLWHDVQGLLVHGQEVDVEHLGGQLAAALVHEPDRLRHPQRAAVAADAVAEHPLHHRIDRDALLHRRQLAGGDPGRLFVVDGTPVNDDLLARALARIVAAQRPSDTRGSSRRRGAGAPP